MKEWGLRELLDICFCSSTQCRGWYVPPDGWNCVISRPLWCWHRNLLPHGVSWDSHHSKGGKKRLILPSMSHSNNSRLSKNICIFFHNQPSRPYSQGVFTFHNTELLLYILIQGKGCYFFLIAALSLFVCPHASTHCLLWNRWKKKLEAFQRETLCLPPDTVAHRNCQWNMFLAHWLICWCICLLCVWLACNIWFTSKLGRNAEYTNCGTRANR